jgi:hypothetical protein
LYDFPKSLIEGDNRTELRFRIGNGEAINKIAEQIDLNHLRYYESKPVNPEVGDLWPDERENFTLYIAKDKEIQLSPIIYGGAKAFKIIAINDDSYSLQTVDNISVGDKVSLYLTNNYDFCGEITNIDEKSKTVKINNFIKENLTEGKSYLLLYEKPYVGDFNIGSGAL